MIITSHQPNFLPGTSFLYKMAEADLLDLRVDAQFTERNYHHRAKLGGKWFTLPLLNKPKFEDPLPINQIVVNLPEAKKLFSRAMQGRYAGAPFYKERGLPLVEFFDSLQSPMLWHINLELILHFRDMLGVDTPVCVGVPAIGGKTEGLLSTFRPYPNVETYLSGLGGKKYMELEMFDQVGIKVRWSEHKDVLDGDSFVTALMTDEYPMEAVMSRNEETQ